MPADIFALYKGRIAGRVLDTNGKPVRNIAITLVSADAKPEHILPEANGKGTGTTMFSNRDGSYGFAQLTPGRYLLVLNRKDFQDSKTELSRMLPTVLYPGVHDISAATVIIVTGDKKPEAYDFVLPIQQ